jgi:hypothetical protein
VYILLIQNTLYVPSLDHNVLPPFMMREAGVVVKDTPNIQLEDPSEEDHALTFPETGFRIPLSLWGAFSYFQTTKPTKDDLVEPEEVYLLTPTRWNPHTDAYAKMPSSKALCVDQISLQKAFISLEICSPDMSATKASGAPISFANCFIASRTSPFLFMGTT